MVEEFLEDAVSKDVILEKGEVWVDFLRKGGMGDVCGMKQDPFLVSVEFNDMVAQVTQRPFVGFVGMEFV